MSKQFTALEYDFDANLERVEIARYSVLILSRMRGLRD
jgi:hypothetical protein